MSDLLFLADLLLLLLSAFYTDRTANAFIASQSAGIEAQHNTSPIAAELLSTVPDVRRASLSMGPDTQRHPLGGSPQLESLTAGSRSLVKSLSRGKRDFSLQPGVTQEPSTKYMLNWSQHQSLVQQPDSAGAVILRYVDK